MKWNVLFRTLTADEKIKQCKDTVHKYVLLNDLGRVSVTNQRHTVILKGLSKCKLLLMERVLYWSSTTSIEALKVA